jgi:DNA-binding FrmR family transcriptional regulator
MLVTPHHHLQAHSSLKTIKKKLVRKVLDAIKKMAETETKCDDTEAEVRAADAARDAAACALL